ncbi:hypothetical protein EDB85DRAFT_1895518 [Lactarius pseudohatsudake]|nr:hypothetical protein EDB85DRAFT_1895518 [Lactarius pseudohatsudake]
MSTESALTHAEVDYRKANTDSKIQQHLTAPFQEHSDESFAGFIMAIDLCSGGTPQGRISASAERNYRLHAYSSARAASVALPVTSVVTAGAEVAAVVEWRRGLRRRQTHLEGLLEYVVEPGDLLGVGIMELREMRLVGFQTSLSGAREGTAEEMQIDVCLNAHGGARERHDRISLSGRCYHDDGDIKNHDDGDVIKKARSHMGAMLRWAYSGWR